MAVTYILFHDILDELSSWFSDSEFGSTYEQHSDEEGKNSESETSREPEFALSMFNGNVSSSAQKVEDSLLENSISRSIQIPFWPILGVFGLYDLRMDL